MLTWMMFHFMGKPAPPPGQAGAEDEAADKGAAPGARDQRGGRVRWDPAGPAESPGAGVIAATKPMSEFAMRKTYWVLYEVRTKISPPTPPATVVAGFAQLLDSRACWRERLCQRRVQIAPLPLRGRAPGPRLPPTAGGFPARQGFSAERAAAHGAAARLARVIAPRNHPGGAYAYDGEARWPVSPPSRHSSRLLRCLALLAVSSPFPPSALSTPIAMRRRSRTLPRPCPQPILPWLRGCAGEALL